MSVRTNYNQLSRQNIIFRDRTVYYTLLFIGTALIPENINYFSMDRSGKIDFEEYVFTVLATTNANTELDKIETAFEVSNKIRNRLTQFCILLSRYLTGVWQQNVNVPR